ncbi:MAG: HAMP domain-containing sensor histidine kinase, partial [Verrucomicrobiota bacterium]|nr:HAMP domain-containing sensor histidine kinase [Verrucomicrobiota bacterium]
PEQDQKWLFNAFQRGRNVGEIPGTGLGLVIVKRCIELHRGTLEISSQVGSGTTVTIAIPTMAIPFQPSGETTAFNKIWRSTVSSSSAIEP